MPFVLKKFKVIKNKTIQISLLQDLDLDRRQSSRLLSRGRIFRSDNSAYKVSDIINEDYIYIAMFEGHTRGLKPLFTTSDFAIFDKPSNLVIHPNSKKTEYSLLDEIRYHFGDNANQAHRIDAETSGLVLVGRKESVTNALATMFEEKEYKKSYLTIVRGEIKEEITIDKNLKKEGKSIGVKMTTCSKQEGKSSITIIKPIKYNKEKNQTLVEAIPITGRQHQIRIHLHSIGHTILGDPIYGVEDDIAQSYLTKTLDDKKRFETSGSYRLWLQANYLEFTYKGVIYKIYSKNKEILAQFES
ncbi:RNA pseudouridine synthase [Malaciobacter pacificus]|uniref:RluA family pseudouridine synthase n=1 Tax=Malaciobacter pacificus TaxID=1080223 RepID=UPI001029BFA7|nr:RluA family pseudouridine synthase [Malaciobacter pacificus]GGD41018.1 RNA pseudouridine synthase [Malaciobacter pacificus]